MRVGRWTTLSVPSDFMAAALILVTQSEGPSPLRAETNELVWGVLSASLVVLAAVVAGLVVVYLVSRLRRGK